MLLARTNKQGDTMNQIEFLCSLNLEQRVYFKKYEKNILELSEKITKKDIDKWEVRQEFINIIFDGVEE